MCFRNGCPLLSVLRRYIYTHIYIYIYKQISLILQVPHICTHKWNKLWRKDCRDVSCVGYRNTCSKGKNFIRWLCDIFGLNCLHVDLLPYVPRSQKVYNIKSLISSTLVRQNTDELMNCLYAQNYWLTKSKIPTNHTTILGKLPEIVQTCMTNTWSMTWNTPRHSLTYKEDFVARTQYSYRRFFAKRQCLWRRYCCCNNKIFYLSTTLCKLFLIQTILLPKIVLIYMIFYYNFVPIQYILLSHCTVYIKEFVPTVQCLYR